MKKKKVKALAKLANLLPATYIIRDHSEGATLGELYRLREEEGKPTDDLPSAEESKYGYDTMMRVTSQAFDRINHLRRLKKAYKENGTQGIKDYVLWVDAHNRRIAPLLRELTKAEPEEVPEGLLEIARGSVSRFWQSLVLFLYSFVATFSSSSKIDDENGNPPT